MDPFHRADFILHNGVIHTLNDSNDIHQSLVISGDRILAVGSDEDLETFAKSASERINLEGRCVLPAFTDSHIHIKKYALNFNQVDCEVESLDECLQGVRDALKGKNNGEWVLGHGWNQNHWHRFGHRKDLDQLSMTNPIYLTAKSLHAGWANSKALEIADVRRGSPDPSGGEIQLDEDGDPTGILFENATQLISKHIPKQTDHEIANLISEAQTHLWKYGIAGIHDFDGSSAFSALQILHNRGKLGLRVVKNVPLDHLSAALELGLHCGFGDHWLRLGNIKLFSDGALGPLTAAMFDPYQEDPHNSGMMLLESEEMIEIGRRAIEAGFGLSIHAIGDKANHEVLNVFEMLRSFPKKKGQACIRHRIEHLQLLHPEDLFRISSSGIIASMQPIHAVSDSEMASRHWGQRTRYAYAWRSVLNAGAVLAFGSDAPVEDPNPFWGIHAAVTRQTREDPPSGQGWIPEERISPADAIRAYTRGAAYAAGRENELGQLNPGFFADLVVLERDPFHVDPRELWKLTPTGTMVGGIWRFRRF